ncbi:hypothetical protein CKO24_02355 [Rhodothalassium salexigens DSM 2132]|nr:hypothetical protein [Rhodothalassium salexigens DSM 2132]
MPGRGLRFHPPRDQIRTDEMSLGPASITPLTPLGLLARPLPRRPLERLLQGLADRLVERHPEMLDRVADAGSARLYLRASDLPWHALIAIESDRAEVWLLDEAPGESEWDAAIEGPLARLLATAGGTDDGDALFFSREIRVTGNSDLAVALRNALDGAEIDFVDELSGMFGPASGLATRGIGALVDAYRAAETGLDHVKTEWRAPLAARIDAQAREIAALKAEVERLRRRAPRGRPTGAPSAPTASSQKESI